VDCLRRHIGSQSLHHASHKRPNSPVGAGWQAV
jgi:hypothetical protein